MKRGSVYQILYLFFCSSFLVVSCSSIGFSNQEDLFQKTISVKEMNSKIRFQKPDSRVNSFRIGNDLLITLENLTDDFIELPGSYGMRIFTFDQGGWKELDNEMGYFPNDAHLRISPKGQVNPNIVDIPLLPGVSSDKEEITIRVVVIGNIVKAGTSTNEEVGAFIDVTLHR